MPLAIDLYCGLGGWAEGFLAEGYDVIGFDIERHDYGTGGYPGQLVLQDVLTLHGSQFKNAAVIVASPPCQEYSYMAMPWSRAKVIAEEYRSGVRDVKKLTALFDACFRIATEASDAAGRVIPLIVENVRGAVKWVSQPVRWHFGSYYLWGDVPALMPITFRGLKLPGNNGPRMWNDRKVQRLCDATKNNGGSWFAVAHNTESGHSKNPVHEGTKVSGDWFGSYAEMKSNGTISPGRLHGKNSVKRKAASAQIAKIPFPLSNYIARVFKEK